MRSGELTTYVCLGGLAILLWLAWGLRLVDTLWLPAGTTLAVILLFLARMILVSLRQD